MGKLVVLLAQVWILVILTVPFAYIAFMVWMFSTGQLR